MKKLLIIFPLLFLSASIASAQPIEKTIVISKTITITNNMTDPIGMGEMSYSVDSGETWTAPEPYTAEKELTLPDGPDGDYCIQARFSDSAGNWTPLTEPKTVCCYLKTVPPEGDPEIKGLKIIVEFN